MLWWILAKVLPLLCKTYLPNTATCCSNKWDNEEAAARADLARRILWRMCWGHCMKDHNTAATTGSPIRRWSKVTVRNERLTFNNGMPFKTSLQSCWVVTIWSSGQVWRFLRSELQPKEGINLRSHYLFRLHVSWGKLLSFARFSCQIFCNQKENIHVRVWSRVTCHAGRGQ